MGFGSLLRYAKLFCDTKAVSTVNEHENPVPKVINCLNKLPQDISQSQKLTFL